SVGAEEAKEAKEDWSRANILEYIAGGDPSFEMTSGSIYEYQWGATHYQKVSAEDSNVRTGDYSVLLDYSSNNGIIPFAATMFLLDTSSLPIVSLGQEYTLSFWTKSTDGLNLVQGLYLYAMGLNDNQTFELTNKTYTSGVSGEWEKFEVKFTLPKTYGDSNKAVRGIRMVFYQGSVAANGKLYIDDISLEKTLSTLTGEQVDYLDLDVTTTNAVFAGAAATIDTDTYIENEGSASLKVVADNSPYAGMYYVIPKEKLANDIYIFSFMVKLENVSLSTASYPFGLLAKPTLNKDMADYGGEVIYYDGYDLRNHVQTHIAVRPNLKEDGVSCGDNGVALSSTPRSTEGWIKVEVPFNIYGLPDGASVDAEGNSPLSIDEVTGMALKINFGCVSGTMYFDNFKVYRAGTEEPSYRKEAVLYSPVYQGEYSSKATDGTELSGKACIVFVEIIGFVPEEYGITVTYIDNGETVTKEFAGKSISDGKFGIALYEMPDGEYTVKAYADNLSSVTANVTVTSEAE
ncbi:MAG: hypothetical protein ACI4S9_05830, partial [Christensenellales bacterium]